ncbi:hypothetical protein F3J22_13795 [Chitinophaga sp. Cy-1792]|nr:hypothetical protein [Chitinophaga sp. Cy-1792]
MQTKKLLDTTDHRRTYNVVKKEMFAVCSRCHWHPTVWLHCTDNPFRFMRYHGDANIHPNDMKFKNLPSWKIVSKNRKQWMKKKFMTESTIMRDGSLWVEKWW